MTAIAFGWPLAVRRVPSSGSTATSTSGPVPSPTSSPLKSIGALSFSPSPMTTTPAIRTVSSIARMPSTAAWSADSLSPRPIQRPAPIAAASVTRTSSSARFRSGARAEGSATDASGRAMGSILHPVWGFHPDEIEAARDHRLGRPAEAEPEGLRVALEHAVAGVEAVEVVGDADRVVRDPLRPAPLGRLGGDIGELGEPFDQIALLGLERASL